ncbi:MAG: M20 family metallopeptidase [Candidatus Kapaibacteriales bacterium]
MNRETILKEVEEIFPKVVEYRRHIHQNPELSFQEYNTQKYIKSILQSKEIECSEIADTGILGLLGNPKHNDNCIALRADIDALPIIENTGLEFSSKNNGVMHACGHDMHTAMLLGASLILKKHEESLEKRIKLFFQPGEEKIPGGASLMIKDGALENPKPRAIFGQHIYPGAEVGKVLTKEGPVMAAADELYWTINGKSTHAAQPQLGHDPILCASTLIQQYQNMITKYRDPLKAGVLNVTSIHGGNATNVIPDQVEMMGTFRSFDNSWRQMMHSKLTEITKSVGDIYGCDIDFEIKKGYPPVINDQALSEEIKSKAVEMFSENRYSDFEPKMWGEDFGYYSQAGPSVFWFIGVRPKDETDMPALHNSKLNPDEEAMKTGMAMMLSVCFD